MRAEIWCRSADGLTGTLGWYEVKPEIVTAIAHRIVPAPPISDPLAVVSIGVTRRRYEFWKMDGELAWYREITDAEATKMKYDVEKIEAGLDALKKAGVCAPGQEAIRTVLAGLGVEFPKPEPEAGRAFDPGARFDIDGSEYMLVACGGGGQRILVNLANGNRYDDPVSVFSFSATWEEVKSMAGSASRRIRAK